MGCRSTLKFRCLDLQIWCGCSTVHVKNRYWDKGVATRSTRRLSVALCRCRRDSGTKRTRQMRKRRWTRCPLLARSICSGYPCPKWTMATGEVTKSAASVLQVQYVDPNEEGSVEFRDIRNSRLHTINNIHTFSRTSPVSQFRMGYVW